MPDPRPTSDDPLIISGQVPRALTQAPSTLDFGRTPYCPAAPCAQCRSEPGSCCCLGPGCTISGGPCYDPPFPPCPAQGGGCCGIGASPASSYSLVLSQSTCQTITWGACGTILSYDTLDHSRGFSVSLPATSVTIPKTGLWMVNAKSHWGDAGASPRASYLQLLKCCVACADFKFHGRNSCCIILDPGFEFTTTVLTQRERC